MAQVGTGTVFALVGAPVGFFADILSLGHSGVERPSIDTSTLATTTARTFIPGNLVTWGEVEMELLMDPSLEPPMNVAPANATITFPDASVWTFPNSFATGWAATAPLEDRITGTLTVVLGGDLTIT